MNVSAASSADASAHPSGLDLIPRFFDETLTPEELRRLSDLLDADPAAARAFAGIARLQAGLEALAPPLPLRRRWWRTRGVPRLTAAAALMVLTGAGTWLALKNRPGGGAVPDHSRTAVNHGDPAPPEPGPDQSSPPVRIRRILKAGAVAGSLRSLAPARMQSFLSGYSVNLTPDGLRVSEALRRLEEEIRAVNLYNRPELDGLTFSARESLVPGDPDPVIHFPATAGMSVTDYLRICGCWSLITCTADGSAYGTELRDLLAEAGAGTEMITEDLKFHPDLLSVTAAGSPGRTAPAVTGIQLLKEKFGFPLADGESATVVPSAASLTVHLARPRLLRLRSLLTVHANLERGQLMLTAQYYEMPASGLPEGFPADSGLILGPQETGAMRKRLREMPGASLFQAPALVIRRNQWVRAEILSEAGRQTFGFRQPVTWRPFGEVQSVTGSVEITLPEGLKLADAAKGLGALGRMDPAVLSAVEPEVTEFELYIPGDHSAMFLVEAGASPGNVTLAWLTPLFTTGAVKYGIPVAGNPGFVQSPYAPEKGLVNVTGLRSGQKVKCPYTGEVFLVP